VSEQELELLQFPTAYPIKVVCRRRADLRIVIDEIVRRHTPELGDDAIQERDSSAGNYVSISYALTARSAEHITALIVELRSHDAVVMVL
jgi:putative lipoic acid-binding regulatory protein